MMKHISVVWQPKYCTKQMLIKTSKVLDSEDCYVFFSSDPSWPDIYKYNGSRVLKECSIDKGNYLVPLSWLSKFTDFPVDDQFMVDWKAEEDANYQKYLEKKRKARKKKK